MIKLLAHNLNFLLFKFSKYSDALIYFKGSYGFHKLISLRKTDVMFLTRNENNLYLFIHYFLLPPPSPVMIP